MVFAPGPIFANIVLADEINRTPPKTQSALLEAMQEHRVTIQGRTYELDEPFFVFATQNPIELEGTYPLPEAQLDRFMFHIVIEHPPEDEEFDVVRATTAIIDPHFKQPVNGADLVAFQRLVRRVPVAEPVMRYALHIVRTSRPKSTQAPELGEEVRGVRRQRPRGAVPGARRQGARADQRPLSRELRGHPRAGAPGAAAPRADQLPRRVGRHHDGLDHRRAADGRAGPEERHVRTDATAERARPQRKTLALRSRRSPRLMPNMSTSTSDPRRAVRRPEDPARVGNLELLARNVVDGFINGLHRAPFFGASIDFAEHRGYVAGDDIRRVDWRLFARTDRFYVKQYEADTNTNFSVLLDISKSMRFTSRGIPKLEYGCYRRRVPRLSRAAPARPRRHHHLRQRHRHARAAVGEALQRRAAHAGRAKAERPGNLAVPLNKMAEHFKRRSILVLISDFYEEPDAILEAIKPLKFLGNDLIVFHVLDPAEIDFGYEDASSFEDLESGEQMPVVPESLVKEYRALIQAHIAR